MMVDKHVVIVGQIRAESKLNKNNFLTIIKDCCKDNNLNLREDFNNALNKLNPLQSEFFKDLINWDRRLKRKPHPFRIAFKHHMSIFNGRKLEYNIKKTLRDSLRDIVLKKTSMRI